MSGFDTTCTCGKVRYVSKADARRAKRRQPGKGHLSAYPCPAGCGWHLGHLPAPVLRGEAPRTRYRKRTTA